MGNEPIIKIQNSIGDTIAFHRHNIRKAHCIECQVEIATGRGVQRKMHNHPGSGYLCDNCAGAMIRTHTVYMYNRGSAILSPCDPSSGVVICYSIPSAELAQAFHDHGAYGLRFAAENLREQARATFLTARNIPFTKEEINIVTFAEALS